MCRVTVSATQKGCYMTGDSLSLQPTIEVRSPQPHAALVVLGGEHDLYSADQLRETIDMSLSGCEHLIVDLSAAEFIDSTIIGMLVQTMKKATGVGRKFSVVLGTAPAVERALELSEVLPLLNVVPTVERALAA
jgi:anti-sigma B factor antagonist